MFRVTLEWLKEHSTKGMAWNKQQLAILGISWPPPRGWLDQVIGKKLPIEAKERFEEETGRSIQKLDIKRRLIAAVDYPVYYTTPDGKGSFKGRWLKPEEVGTWPKD